MQEVNMIRIILNGCGGKMGKSIIAACSNFSNLEIVAGIDKFVSTQGEVFPIYNNISQCAVDADVILDFSRPDALEDIMNYAIKKSLPVVMCTTGFTKEQIDFINKCSNTIPVFRSANMSIGINVINSMLKKISSFLFENYDIEIIEKHHNQKVDSPSGTALLLANTIKDSIPQETDFVYGREGLEKRDHKEIGIHAVRGGSIVGDHEVIFAGQGEIIELKHVALSREVFAVGALKACEFLADKSPGLYSMDNIVNNL
jgi:4-hydroxy-tetrahydrodipicolinate reductase